MFNSLGRLRRELNFTREEYEGMEILKGISPLLNFKFCIDKNMLKFLTCTSNSK
jgi:hypothetical protein